ncbi:MAG: toxin-antitoxin system YwqK family antitoxin [Spirosomataceae bacterium]
MKILQLMLFCFFVYGCQPKQKGVLAVPMIPKKYVLKSAPEFTSSNDTLLWKGQKYSGFVYEISQNGKDTLLVEGYYEGLQSGLSQQWYTRKQVREIRHYREGKKEGLQVGYWENGRKRFEFMAQNGEYEGELKEWSSNGHLYHLATYLHGHEEGPQKMWYDNGKIRANYVIVQGKRYGLLGTKNCKNVSDSIFVVK